jgi:S-DNA-T family DNA segregation ATPase FtsK/SpoIIIE
VKKSRRAREPSHRTSADIEAIGLVLVALGLFLFGVLVPALPTGELGRTIRAALTGRVGWAAFALPVPFLALGGLFLLRRNPTWWPRLGAGYLVLIMGLWGLLAAVAPQGAEGQVGAAGSWGLGLRTSLGRAWGTLALIPAIVIATLGMDLLLGWRPLRLLTGVLRAAAAGVKSLYQGAAAARLSAKSRAAFFADAAVIRRGMTELDKDLRSLSTLFPGSEELERWRQEVRDSTRRLRAPTDAGMRESRADLKAWRSAVNDFARDRAADMAVHLDAEGALPPEPDAGTFETWCHAVRQALDDGFDESVATAASLDKLRKVLTLDLTALIERNRRLSRERDLDKKALKGMTPSQLAAASAAHHARVAAFQSVQSEADRLSDDATALESWRDHVARLAESVDRYPADAELEDYDLTLAREIDAKGRPVLMMLHGWEKALSAVEQRAAERHLARIEGPEHGAYAVQSGSESRPPRVDAGFTTQDELPWEVEHRDHQPSTGRDQGAMTAQHGLGHVQTQSHTQTQLGVALDPALAAALLDDRVAVAEPPPRSIPATTAPTRTRATVTLRDGLGRTDDGEKEAPRPVPAVGGIPIQLPPLELLDEPEPSQHDKTQMLQEHRARVRQIDETFANFKLGGRVVAAVRGPTVTRFEVEPAPGEKISRFSNLSDDLALAMAAASVRIEAPIPGKSVIGLEVPNAHRELVRFREAAEAPSFRRAKARLPLILGKSIDGDMVVGDLAKMPHLLIAGSTGSGKSVAVNTLVGSLLYRFLPTELRFLMIDPKMVELTPFDGIPHLLRPVVTNPKDASGVLLGAVTHMERRYQMMSKLGAKNLDQYNEKARNLDLPPMPFIAIIIDELADLMITSPKEVESSIMRLAQMARATGMHLILATQRPSVDILTSLIKVNVPARMAFAVSSSHDSRTILDGMGAERLIGQGDMLFYQPGLVKAVRLQGPYVAENEIARLSDFLRRQYFDDDFVEAYGADFDPPATDDSSASGFIDWNDDKLRHAAELVINEGQASVSRLQRRLSVGHARAGKLMDSLEALGVVGPHTGSKPREVLVAFEELPNIFGK